jgi:hypothetical protein
MVDTSYDYNTPGKKHACKNCPAGKFGDNGTCAMCPEGKQPQRRTDCATCAAGKHRAAGTAGNCADCDAGKQPDAPKAACTACARTQYSHAGQLCGACASGQQPHGDRTKCDACPSGRAGNTGQCTACLPGTVPKEKTLDACHACAGSVSDPCSSCAPCSSRGADGLCAPPGRIFYTGCARWFAPQIPWSNGQSCKSCTATCSNDAASWTHSAVDNASRAFFCGLGCTNACPDAECPGSPLAPEQSTCPSCAGLNPWDATDSMGTPIGHIPGGTWAPGNGGTTCNLNCAAGLSVMPRGAFVVCVGQSWTVATIGGMLPTCQVGN